MYVVFVGNMAETIKGAVKLIEQGHVRIGPELVKDPALLVTRTLEDFVTWVDSSKIKKHVLEYNGMVKKLLMEIKSCLYIVFVSEGRFCFVIRNKHISIVKCIFNISIQTVFFCINC